MRPVVEEQDPAAGLLDRLGGDAAVVRRAGFARLYADGRPVLASDVAAACGLTEAGSRPRWLHRSGRE
jgi:hypothetical protein